MCNFALLVLTFDKYFYEMNYRFESPCSVVDFRMLVCTNLSIAVLQLFWCSHLKVENSCKIRVLNIHLNNSFVREIWVDYFIVRRRQNLSWVVLGELCQKIHVWGQFWINIVDVTLPCSLSTLCPGILSWSLLRSHFYPTWMLHLYFEKFEKSAFPSSLTNVYAVNPLCFEAPVDL